jgi:acylphosphatase
MPDLTLRLRITGRVQGVGYRAFVERQAARFNLAGWVRNRADGSVEAVVAGDRAAVDAMIAACRTGPRSAVVMNVETDAAAPVVEPGFRVLPTG